MEEQIDQVDNRLDHVDHVDHVDQVVQVDQMDSRLDHVDHVDQVDQVDHVDHVGQVDQVDQVDYRPESPDQDLLMRIEEQISTQVAKTESDDESGDEGDPVMVTCGKLIISAPDTEESEDKELQEVIREGEEKHFALKCIEKVDDEDFEAVFEINSDVDEIGLSESDIKALELMESREQIVLRGKSEEPPQDDFSSSVLKFQDAIENYTKSVFTGISDTITEIEKAKTVADERFSEKVSQVEDKYAGRVPVVEEPFEEVKAYICGEPNDRMEDEHFNKLPIIEEPLEEVRTYVCGGSNEKLEISDLSPELEEPFEEIKLSHVEDLTISDSENNDIGLEAIKEEKDVANSYALLDEDCLPAAITEKNTIDRINLEDVDEPIIKVSDIPKLLDLETVVDETEDESQIKFEEDSLLQSEMIQSSSGLEKVEEINPVNESLDKISDKIDEDTNMIPVPEYSERLQMEQSNQTTESNKEESVEKSAVHVHESKGKTSENQILSNSKENDEECEERLKSEPKTNQGIQRNAESRKSKKKIRITKPEITEENTSKCRADKSEDMALLLKMILLIALGIFLYLISGETPSFKEDEEDDSFTRIPARVSGVIDGYIQLSTLAEMELRK